MRPRPVLPDTTYLVTRRCNQRQFLLRPDKKTNQAYLYCLGEAAAHVGIDLIAAVAMSNDHHAVVHDPRGVYPEFIARLHGMLANASTATAAF